MTAHPDAPGRPVQQLGRARVWSPGDVRVVVDGHGTDHADAAPVPVHTSVTTGMVLAGPVGATQFDAVPPARAESAPLTLLSISSAAVGLLSYACTIALAHLLDPAYYAAFAASAALVGTAGVAASALVPLPLAAHLRRHPAGTSARRDAMTFAMAVSLVVGLAVAAVLAVLTSAFGLPRLVLATAAAALSLFLIAPVWGALQGESRFVRLAGLSVGEVAARLAVTVSAVLLLGHAAAAMWGFVVGSAVVALAGGGLVLRQVSRSPARWWRVLRDRERWNEIAAVAVVQVVLSGLSVADAVVVATVIDGAGHSADLALAAAGYQAVSTIAKAPVYLAVAAVMVGYPQLRADAERAPRQLVAHTLRSFCRLLVPGVAVVATLPSALALLVLPASYAPALTLLPWLAAAGAGVAGSTVLAMLLLALREYRALVAGLVCAAIAMVAGLVAGLTVEDPLGAGGPGPGVAHGAAAGAVAGGMILGAFAAKWVRHALDPIGKTRGLWAARWKRLRSFVRYVLAAVVAITALALTRDVLVLWVLVAAVLGLTALGVPVAAHRASALVDAAHRPEHAGAPDPVENLPPGSPHVLHLGFEDPRMPGSGGGALRTAEIGRRLAAQGWRITVVCQRYPGAADRTEMHGAGSLRWVHTGPDRAWLTGSRLGRLLGYVAALPFFVRGTEPDLVVEDFFAPVSSVAVPWWGGQPTVGVVQWLNAEEKARQYRVPVHWVQWLAVRTHRHLIAMSAPVADRLRQLSPRAHVDVVGNGVDPAARTVDGVPRSADVVFVGRLEINQKGLDLLLDAWALAAPRIGGTLVLAGTGPDEAELRDRVARLGVADRVRFAGWVAGRDKFVLMAGARLLVVPSRFETFGIVAAEGLATGTPVLVADVPALQEIVRDGTGVLVPTSTSSPAVAAQAWAEAIVDAHGDAELHTVAARRGPVLAAEHDWDALAATQAAIYRRVLEAP